MDMQTYIDRLLETENLTADLEDAEADWLLQWGIGQIPIVIEGYADAAMADEKVSALMGFIRRASRIVARKDRRAPAELAQMLHELSEIHAQAYGGQRSVSPADCERAAMRMQGISPAEALQFLVEWPASM